MFCWAQQLAAQAAMPLTQAAGGASEAAGPSQQLVIVPGLELMPQVSTQPVTVMGSVLVMQSLPEYACGSASGLFVCTLFVCI
jgi:hypothetical protein